MLNLTIRIIVLGLLLLLPVIGVRAQQPADQRKKVPIMSSDDIGPAGSASQPMPGSVATSDGMSRYRLESCGLSIELPAAPVDSVMPVPAGGAQSFGSFKYHASVGDNYVVAVGHYQGNGQSSLEGQFDEFVRGFFQGFSSDPSHSNVKYTLLDKSSNRASFRGGYDLKVGRASFEGFVQVQGRHGWVVIAIYPAANAEVVLHTRRILSSARFDGEPCPD